MKVAFRVSGYRGRSPILTVVRIGVCLCDHLRQRTRICEETVRYQRFFSIFSTCGGEKGGTRKSQEWVSSKIFCWCCCCCCCATMDINLLRGTLGCAVWCCFILSTSERRRSEGSKGPSGYCILFLPKGRIGCRILFCYCARKGFQYIICVLY